MQDNNHVGQRELSVTFVWLAVLFCICLVSSNIFVPRVWKVWGLPLQLTGGVVIFPISYILNDCLTEVYGYRKARLVIWMGFAMSLFVTVMSQIVAILPAPMEPGSQAVCDSFDTLFSMVPRTMIASLLAFFFGSTINSLVMSRMKVHSEGKGFGVRAIVSSLGGEMIDSLIFFPIVFWGVMGPGAIIRIMLTQVVVKTMYEVIILPVTARVVRFLKKHEGVDTFDENISYNPFKVSDI